jgi:YVTN family beta-propeller protein
MRKLLQRRVIALLPLVKTMTEVRRRGQRSCWVASAAGLLIVSLVGCGGSETAGQKHTTGDEGANVQQAPTLPGAQAISSSDRVYTADQSSNTVTVIDPSANDNEGEVLGTLPLGQPRLDGVLGPVDRDQVNVHGLGFSRDGRLLDVVDVTSNAAQIVDASTNEVVQTTYVGRAPHEAFISPDSSQLWTTVRGEDYVSVNDVKTGEEIDRIETAKGASKVVFSPDESLAFVNHHDTNELDVIDVSEREVIERIPIPEEASGSADLAISPDGEEAWLGHPMTGKTTVVNAEEFVVETVLDTGPRTNHPNFVTNEDGEELAYVTVAGTNQTLVYRRSEDDGEPEMVDQIENSGGSPHGIWPSPDNTRVYVALQKFDAVDVIDTSSNEVINTLSVGQDPQALVYVAGAVPEGDGRSNLTEQGLGKRIENFELEMRGMEEGSGTASIREVMGLEEIDVAARGLPANQASTVYASDGTNEVALMDVRSNDQGVVDEALAFTKFFDNNYDRVILVPEGQQP